MIVDIGYNLDNTDFISIDGTTRKYINGNVESLIALGKNETLSLVTTTDALKNYKISLLIQEYAGS